MDSTTTLFHLRGAMRTRLGLFPKMGGGRGLAMILVSLAIAGCASPERKQAGEQRQLAQQRFKAELEEQRAKLEEQKENAEQRRKQERFASYSDEQLRFKYQPLNRAWRMEGRP